MLSLYYMGLSNNTLCLIDNGKKKWSKILGIRKKKNKIIQFIKTFLAVHCASFNVKFKVKLH